MSAIIQKILCLGTLTLPFLTRCVTLRASVGHQGRRRLRMFHSLDNTGLRQMPTFDQRVTFCAFDISCSRNRCHRIEPVSFVKPRSRLDSAYDQWPTSNSMEFSWGADRILDSSCSVHTGCLPRHCRPENPHRRRDTGREDQSE